MCKNQKRRRRKKRGWGDIVINYLMYRTILCSLNLTGWEHKKYSIKIIWHRWDLGKLSRLLKVVWTGKAQWVVSLSKIWHLSHISGLKNCHAGWLPSQPAGFLCWSLHRHIFFMWVKNKWTAHFSTVHSLAPHWEFCKRLLVSVSFHSVDVEMQFIFQWLQENRMMLEQKQAYKICEFSI